MYRTEALKGRLMMLIHEDIWSGQAISETPVVPALELEELLEGISAEPKVIASQREREIIQDGIDFLRLATEGRQIALRTIREGKISLDLARIRACLLVNRVLQQSNKLQDREFEEVLHITNNVLNRILTGSLDEYTSLNRRDVEIARALFVGLSRIPVQRCHTEPSY